MMQVGANPTELFLEKYRALESLVVNTYHVRQNESAINYLMRRSEFQKYREELDFCREVRNLLTHNPKINGAYLVEPSHEMIAILDKLLHKIEHPLTAIDIAVGRKEILFRGKDGFVRAVMAAMRDRAISHVPILEQERVIGVFSEYTLLSYLVDQGYKGIAVELRFSDMAEYLALDRYPGESFAFIPPDLSADRIEKIFDAATKDGKRIGLLFVTVDGKPQGKLLGIISAWDMAGVD